DVANGLARLAGAAAGFVANSEGSTLWVGQLNGVPLILSALVKSLLAVPVGAGINATTGVFNWTPSEAQGPGIYSIDVVVEDNGSPVLADRETIEITVNEVNQAPELFLGP